MIDLARRRSAKPVAEGRRLRVAHVVAVYPPYWAGTGNVAFYNCLELARRGHDVHVFTAQRALGDYGDPDGPRVHRLWTPLRIGNAPLTPGLLVDLGGFDLVHLHWPFMFGSELTWLSLIPRRVPYVITYHLDLRADRRKIFGLYQQVWGPRLVNGARKVIAVSADHLRSCQVFPSLCERQDDIVEVPNGVDAELFNPSLSGAEVRRSLCIPPDAPIILFVAALDSAHEYKGVPDLIQAFGMTESTGARLVIVGDGDMAPGYQRLAALQPTNVRERIVFAGTVAHDRLPAYYAAADLVVLPSRQPESFGMVLIEAMACGKPVVASSSPGVRSVVTHGVEGLLIEPGQVGGLAAAIAELLHDPARRRAMGRSGRARVEEKYTWQKVADALERVYASALA